MKIFIVVMTMITGLLATISIPEHFQADFIQKVTNPKKKVITYEGSMRFSDKNRLKWIYTSPTKKEVCTDGKELTVVDHDLEQVSYYLIDKGLDLLSILREAKKYKDNIYLANYQNRRYTIQVDNDSRIQSVAYFDDLDNKVQIVFRKMKYGKGSPESSDMNCTAPKTYDVIKG